MKKKKESKLPIYFYQRKFDPRDYREIFIYNVKNLSTNVWTAHMMVCHPYRTIKLGDSMSTLLVA